MSSVSERTSRRVRLLAAGTAVAAAMAGCAVAPHRGTADAAGVETLRVCADPNNLPFSNRRAEGFENAIAAVLAEDLGVPVTYAWWPQRRGFVRNTLNARRCDVVIGVPVRYELTLNTRPYYRSTYVFVSRRDAREPVRSFDDPALKHLRIGVHVVGDDYTNLPPAQALAARHVVGNVYGYSIYGDYGRPDPPRRLIDAVARGDVDVALAWGPLAGYFAQREKVALSVTPVAPQVDGGVPMHFDIALGVRRGEAAWRDRLQRALDRQRVRIDAILAQYGVPRLPLPAVAAGAGREPR